MPILGIIASSYLSAVPNSYESIATSTVGSGGTSYVEFTSISSSYTHLQIRCLTKLSRTTGNEDLYIRFNSDTASNYRAHRLQGDGATASSSDMGAGTGVYIGEMIGTWASAANMFSALVIDILDYKNTNKFKTTRTLAGGDQNGNTAPNGDTGKVIFLSGLWRSTSAISTIRIYPAGGTLNEYSQFALYGIKA